MDLEALHVPVIPSVHIHTTALNPSASPSLSPQCKFVTFGEESIAKIQGGCRQKELEEQEHGQVFFVVKNTEISAMSCSMKYCWTLVPVGL